MDETDTRTVPMLTATYISMYVIIPRSPEYDIIINGRIIWF